MTKRFRSAASQQSRSSVSNTKTTGEKDTHLAVTSNTFIPSLIPKDTPANNAATTATIKMSSTAVATTASKVHATQKNPLAKKTPNTISKPATKQSSVTASAATTTKASLESVVNAITGNISALEAKNKRVAHKPTFQQATTTGPPTILPNVKSNIPLKMRQLIVTKIYEAFVRIYQPILHIKPGLATEHAKIQEEQILRTTVNQAGYKQMATNVLMNLKRRPVSTGEKDIGIDGEWVDPASIKSDMTWTKRVPECIASLEKLKEMKYPLPDVLSLPTAASANDDNNSGVGTVQECDRCHQDFTVKHFLEASDMTACIYHAFRNPYVKQLKDGSKEKVHLCCDEKSGSSDGCKKGPHVYKEESVEKLHQKIPFVQAPAKSTHAQRQDVVALDCEMGYTTGGLEMIRFTMVDIQGERLIDELVLPSNMIIDLNTEYSGIATLKGASYDLETLRNEIFKFVDQDTIIVGHGLENDLNVLRIVHTKIIDTAELFPHSKGLPFRNSLRFLAQAHLRKFIQTGTDGHDSLEDARTCIELLELFIKKVLDKRLQGKQLTPYEKR